MSLLPNNPDVPRRMALQIPYMAERPQAPMPQLTSIAPQLQPPQHHPYVTQERQLAISQWSRTQQK